jgi:cell division protein FtsB
MKLLLLTLFTLFLGLQYKLWFESDSLPRTWHLHQAIINQLAENQGLLERNNALAAEVEDLKHGRAAIEERARNELGMIREGETFYQIIEGNASNDG